MNAVTIQNLTKVYGRTAAVDGLSLTIPQGELFALLGINGCGKTTTVKMLSCLTTPTHGDALILGHSLRDDAEAVKGLIGISPQETAVAMGLTVQENLQLMGGIHGFHKQKTAAKVAELTEIFQLQEVLHKKASKLSGGWQRRLSIAMALMGEPQVLFLDEPTLGLDVLARSQLWDTLKQLKGRITILLTTHYMEEAEALSDRIGIMKNGRLSAVGTAAELKQLTGKEKFEEAFIALVREELP